MQVNRIAGFMLATSFLALPVRAQTAGELLQKGIYTQETAGDLDGAIAIYRQIVNSGNSPRDVAAQAQYRLAQSLLQKGDLSNGATEFSNLARNYADYGKLIGSLAAEAQRQTQGNSATIPLRFRNVEQANADRERELLLRQVEDLMKAGVAGPRASDAATMQRIKAAIARLDAVNETHAANEAPQPDRVLFDKGFNSMQQGDYAGARLALNTIINTYPASTYLPLAKLAIANSWLQEGGPQGRAQAQAELNDFVQFYGNSLPGQTAGPGGRGLRKPGAGVGGGVGAGVGGGVGAAMATMTFDVNITVKGTVFRIEVANPAGSISVDSGDGKLYTFLIASAAENARQGLTRSALRIGDAVTVTGMLSTGSETLQDGSIAASATTITRQSDGKTLFDRALIKEKSQLNDLSKEDARIALAEGFNLVFGDGTFAVEGHPR